MEKKKQNVHGSGLKSIKKIDFNVNQTFWMNWLKGEAKKKWKQNKQVIFLPTLRRFWLKYNSLISTLMADSAFDSESETIYIHFFFMNRFVDFARLFIAVRSVSILMPPKIQHRSCVNYILWKIKVSLDWSQSWFLIFLSNIPLPHQCCCKGKSKSQNVKTMESDHFLRFVFSLFNFQLHGH